MPKGEQLASIQHAGARTAAQADEEVLVSATTSPPPMLEAPPNTWKLLAGNET